MAKIELLNTYLEAFHARTSNPSVCTVEWLRDGQVLASERCISLTSAQAYIAGNFKAMQCDIGAEEARARDARAIHFQMKLPSL